MNLSGGNSGIKFDANSSYERNVADGSILGVNGLHKFGQNHLVGTTFEDMWSSGGMYVYPPSASTMTLSSSSTDDDVAGTGALTVLVEGLDANYLEVSETLVLTGQVAVTTQVYLRLNRMTVLTAGSGDTNAGTIYVGTGTVTSGVPATIYISVTAGEGQSSHGIYTVPATKTVYLYSWYMASDSQKAVEVNFKVRPFGGIFNKKGGIHFFDGVACVAYRIPEQLVAKTDIRMEVKVDAGTAGMESWWLMEVVDD